MTRGLSAAELAAAAGGHRARAPLLEILFDSGPLRLAMWPWNIPVGGDMYIGTGGLVSMRELSESADSVEGMEFTMDGLDAAVLELAALEPYRGRIVRLLKAFVNPDTNQVVATPKAHFVGRIQSMPIEESNELCKVTLVAEHYEVELRRPAPLRLNDADQQRLYPGDLGCQYVETMTEKQIVWPSAETLRARAR